MQPHSTGQFARFCPDLEDGEDGLGAIVRRCDREVSPLITQVCLTNALCQIRIVCAPTPTAIGSAGISLPSNQLIWYLSSFKFSFPQIGTDVQLRAEGLLSHTQCSPINLFSNSDTTGHVKRSYCHMLLGAT
jgi:hypothetical protein